jgi:hypothetical protein
LKVGFVLLNSSGGPHSPQPTETGTDIELTIWQIVAHDGGLTAGKTTGQVVLPTIRGKRRRLARKRLCDWPGHTAQSDPPEPKQQSQLACLRL